MEVKLVVPEGTDISLIAAEYSDIYEDCTLDGETEYWIGQSSDEEHDGDEWMSREEAIEFCGFCDGVLEDVEDAFALIEGNGAWAQGLLSRKDFSGLDISEAERDELKRESKIYYRGYRKGKRNRLKKET